MKKRTLIHKLYEIGAIKFGEFTLKSKVISPFYIDLRLVISSPKLLSAIAELMYEAIRETSFDLICGVPYTALPIATAISIQHTIPMILCRKEKKEYGTKKQIEGIYEPKQCCTIIEDVITSGKSIFETIQSIAKAKMIVQDIVVLVDREQGGRNFIEKQNYFVHPICTITEIIDELLYENKISKKMHLLVKNFIQTHQTHA